MPGPRTKTSGATVHVVDERPKRPRVDSGDEFEGQVRQMFKPKVEAWCKANLEGKTEKEVIGNVVDNLTAQWSSAIETIVDAATDSYLSTTDEGEDEVECPKCEHVFEVPEDEKGDLVPYGTIIQCPECRLRFELQDPGDDDGGDDPNGGERATGT